MTLRPLLIAALALALAACGAPSVKQWEGLGACVWKDMTAADKAAVIGAVEAGQPISQAAGGNLLRDRTRQLAYDCHPGAQLDENRAGRIVALSLSREATAALIDKHLHRDRRRLEVAIQLAPPELKASLRQTGAFVASGGGMAAPMESIGPIQANLGLPADDAFADTREGGWLTQFVMNDYAIRALAEAGARR